MLNAGGRSDGTTGSDSTTGPDGNPSPAVPPEHEHSESEITEIVSAAGGQGPLRLLGLAIVLFVFGFVLRWGQDVTAPYVNVGEADMASPVAFESDGGTYRVVSSGPSRPELRFTVCEATAADGSTRQETGRDGVNGGHTRFGVTRVTKFDLPPGPAEISCGHRDPRSGVGLGRFQVVEADGPMSLAVTGLLAGGAASLVGAAVWFFVRYRRHSA